MSDSEMEHYLSFLLFTFALPSVALCTVLSAQTHSLGRGGWHPWVPAACLDLVSCFPLFVGIQTKELEIGV